MTRTTTSELQRSDAALAAQLSASLSPDRVHVDRLERVLYGRDASLMRGEAGIVCFPETTGEVQACVRAAAQHGRTVVVRGSGTGLAGGAVPQDGPVLVVTTKMTGVEVDLDNYVIRHGPTEAEMERLSNREQELLRYLIEHRGKVLQRDELLTSIWKYSPGVTTRTVDTHILNVRKKLRDDAAEPRFIETLHGIGYKFVASEF